MDRVSKIGCVVKFLIDRYNAAILDRCHHVFTSDEIDSLSADEITAVLTLLEQQPNCLTFTYVPAYKDRQAIMDSDDPILSERFYAIEPVVDFDDKRKWDELVDYYLGLIRYDVNLHNGFNDGVRAAVKNDNPNIIRNENATAIELLIDGDTLKVRTPKDNKEYIVKKNLSRGLFFQPFLEYAFKNQGKKFKISDVSANSGYKNSTVLKRIFTHSKIYHAFFEVVGGDNGYLIANFRPTYKDLDNANTSVKDITGVLTPY